MGWSGSACCHIAHARARFRAGEREIAACDGDPSATLCALIVANSHPSEQVDTLTKELDWAWHWITPGYTAASISGV